MDNLPECLPKMLMLIGKKAMEPGEAALFFTMNWFDGQNMNHPGFTILTNMKLLMSSSSSSFTDVQSHRQPLEAP